MAISVGTSYMNYNNILADSSKVNADKLSSSIRNINSDTSDEELMEACKGFEQYFVEQVMKEFTKSIEEFQDNKYMDIFGDTLITEYANKVSDSGNLGIAKMLYESMKNNVNSLK